ncbi:MAG: carboxypeptidase-like regulatory domain-containing protein, partial [Segetibacter sp.]
AIAQSTGRISGRITDAQTREPLAGATVALRNGNANAVTDDQGKFVLNNVKPGRYTVVMSFVGYGDATQIVQVISGGDVNVDVELSRSTRTEEEVVVTASRRAEKITRAPASISVINARDLEQSASFLPGELASKLQGVEFIRTGVNGVGINARGFNNAFNAKILQMTDGRNSMMAGGSGLPSGIMNTVIKEDIERLEIVLGP